MGQVFNRQQENPENGPNNPETTWWCRLLARVVSTIGAGIALILAIVCFVNILYPRCIGAGILQLFAAFVVLVFEAPICCQFLEFTKPVANFAEQRTYFQKALIYGILAIPPIAICFGLTTLFGSGLIFVGAVVYGLMALGKKADRNTMRQQATTETGPKMGGEDQRANLIDSQGGDNQGFTPAGGNNDPSNPFSGGNSAQQMAGQYAGQYAGQMANQYVQSQFATK